MYSRQIPRGSSSGGRATNGRAARPTSITPARVRNSRGRPLFSGTPSSGGGPAARAGGRSFPQRAAIFGGCSSVLTRRPLPAPHIAKGSYETRAQGATENVSRWPQRSPTPLGPPAASLQLCAAKATSPNCRPRPGPVSYSTPNPRTLIKKTFTEKSRSLLLPPGDAGRPGSSDVDGGSCFSSSFRDNAGPIRPPSA